MFVTRRHALVLAAGAGVAAVALARPARAAAPGGTMALVEKGAGQLGFYDLATGQRTGGVVLGEQPHEVVRIGDTAFVGAYGVESWHAAGEGGHQLWAVDVARRTPATAIDVAPSRRIHALRADAAGRLYALSETDGILMRFDRPASDPTPQRLWPVGGARSHYMVVRGDGTRAWVADTLGGVVIGLNLADPAAAPVRRAVGTAPEGLALSLDERVLYVLDRPGATINAFDAATLSPLGQRATRGEAVRVLALPGGALLVANRADASLSRLDTRTLAETARLPLPGMPAALNLLAGPQPLYVSTENDRVAAIDLARWRIAGGFATGKSPDTAVLC